MGCCSNRASRVHPVGDIGKLGSLLMHECDTVAAHAAATGMWQLGCRRTTASRAAHARRERFAGPALGASSATALTLDDRRGATRGAASGSAPPTLPAGFGFKLGPAGCAFLVRVAPFFLSFSLGVAPPLALGFSPCLTSHA